MFPAWTTYRRTRWLSLRRGRPLHGMCIDSTRLPICLSIYVRRETPRLLGVSQLLNVKSDFSFRSTPTRLRGRNTERVNRSFECSSVGDLAGVEYEEQHQEVARYWVLRAAHR